MATYASLPIEQKALVEPFADQFRAAIGHLARLLIIFRALDAANQAGSGIDSITSTLDPGERIPNTSGIAGAQELDIADWNALITGMETFLSTYDTAATRQRIAQAAGPTAGL